MHSIRRLENIIFTFACSSVIPTSKASLAENIGNITKKIPTNVVKIRQPVDMLNKPKENNMSSN